MNLILNCLIINIIKIILISFYIKFNLLSRLIFFSKILIQEKLDDYALKMQETIIQTGENL